jgi:SET and MYND domain-containing protein
MELDTVRFIISAIVRRYIHDSVQTAPLLNTWADLLKLQNNELQFHRGRPHALESHLRIYTFVRRIVLSVPALAPYLATSEMVRAILARDPGNVFGMYEMNEEGDSEMLGWSMYVSASFFNHGKRFIPCLLCLLIPRADCAPNVRKERGGRALMFYTTRDVALGEELCINYIDIKDSVVERRGQLSANWYFDCVCERCKKELEAQ